MSANEPYTRWQGFRINQLGVCISLFLTFAVAALGFSINLLTRPNFAITECFAKGLFFFSLVAGLLSVLLGSIACLTRLADFRKTAKVARHRANDNMKAEVERWRKDYKKLGKWTWRLFEGQLLGFGLQAALLVCALAISYWRRVT
jgi:hypothetical protein